MVRHILTICSFIFCFTAFSCLGLSLMADDPLSTSVNVTAQIDAYTTYENQPVVGSISITHDARLEVDASSFKMNSKPFKADLIKDVKMSEQSNIVLSMYQFTLPGQPKGLYVLPEVDVKVGKNVYSSVPSTYEVNGAAPAVPQSNTIPASLTLQQSIDAPPTTFPGHLINVVYKYLYTGDIELTAEYLPLLDAAGFQKVGEKQVTNNLVGTTSVRTVSQEMKAIAPGDFSFPASYVEGYGYVEDGPQKKRTYLQPKLRSETPPVTITVNPFPKKGKPASFNGAVGEFTFTTTLLTDPNTFVDEKMQLALDIGGVADLFDVSIPPLNQLKSLFRFSDLPPTIRSDKSTKRFIVDLYPLSTATKSIPALEFSYFEPLSGQYVTLKSDPIAINVSAINPNASSSAVSPPPSSQPVTPPIAPPPTNISKPVNTAPQTPAAQSQQAAHIPSNVQQPGPVEIASVFVIFASDLENLTAGTWSVFWLIPFAALLIGFQYWLKNYFSKKAHYVKQKTSDEVFSESMNTPFNTPEFYQKLKQAFIQRLAERGDIPKNTVSIEELPNTGVSKDVRSFFSDIEEKRFTGKEALDESTLKANAKKLFDQLK